MACASQRAGGVGIPAQVVLQGAGNTCWTVANAMRNSTILLTDPFMEIGATDGVRPALIVVASEFPCTSCPLAIVRVESFF